VADFDVIADPASAGRGAGIADTGSVNFNEGPIEAANSSPTKSSDSLKPDPAGNKLLYVIGSLDVGGTERHLALLAPRLARLGWRPVVYCLARPGPQAAQVVQAGIEVIPPPIAFAPKGGWLPGRILKMSLSTLKLLWVMISTRPQVAHFFLPGAYLVGAPLSMIARVPTRVMSRRSLNRYQSSHKVLASFERRLHPHMTALLGNSRQVIEELEAEQCPPGRIALIYNGIDVRTFATERTDQATSNQGAAERPLALVTVANLIRYKGHSDLFEALDWVKDSLPVRWTLLCVGRDDGIGDRLRKQAVARGIEANVQFLGERPDVASLLASADIGILCSHEEGFANSILEGMAAGLPMIVTDVGGNAEAVINGTTGLVVPPRNPKALGAAIVNLALDPELRRRMGRAGRERVEKYFGIDRCVANYARLYAGLGRGERPADIDGLDSMV
jgi:glycosyltransferase involved in cell wall biosynthesis